MKETVFWKVIAWVLGFLVFSSLVINAVTQLKIPPQVTSLLLGGLVSIGVGYSIVSPRSSPVRLSNDAERVFRKEQYIVGLIFSIVLALSFLLPDVRDVPFSWFLIPIILLGPFLIIREALIKVRGTKSGASGL